MFLAFVPDTEIIPQETYLFVCSRRHNFFDSFNLESAVFFDVWDGRHSREDAVAAISTRFGVEESLVERDYDDLAGYLHHRRYVTLHADAQDRPLPVWNKGRTDTTKIVHADVEVTRNCNLRCKYCYAETESSRDLSPSMWITLLTELYSQGLRAVKLSGGEPFLCRGLRPLLERVAGKLIVTVNTNGTVIDNATARWLASLDLQCVQVSLDGVTPEAHEQMRGPGTWRMARGAIDLLLAAGVPTRISLTLHRGNRGDVEPIKRLAEELGCDVNIEMMKPVGRAAEINHAAFLPDPATYGFCDSTAPVYKTLKPLKVRCQAELGFVGISSDGWLKPCNLSKRFFQQFAAVPLQQLRSIAQYDASDTYRVIQGACLEKGRAVQLGDLPYNRCVLFEPAGNANNNRPR